MVHQPPVRVVKRGRQPPAARASPLITEGYPPVLALTRCEPGWYGGARARAHEPASPEHRPGGGLRTARAPARRVPAGSRGGDLLPYALYFAALARISAAHVSVTSTLEPVVSGLVAFAVLGETLAPPQLAGGALILAGIGLLHLRR